MVASPQCNPGCPATSCVHRRRCQLVNPGPETFCSLTMQSPGLVENQVTMQSPGLVENQVNLVSSSSFWLISPCLGQCSPSHYRGP
jgi:hypothetical protein